MEANRSFDFIAFPPEVSPPAVLTGHDRLHADLYHGSLTLKLTALTPVFISAGITAMGRDVGETVPLIRVMEQDQNGNPILQGTSLKGCLRAVYETITNSRVAVEGESVGNHKPNKVESKTLKARQNPQLSPAELVFGAMSFQGLISIADAVGDRSLERGYLPPMFQPKHGSGRKFYFHHNPTALTNPQLDAQSPEPDKPPSPIQQAPTGTVFTTTLRFANLTLAQLGAVLVALGQDPDHRFDLKLGAGKGKGLGSLAVQVSAHQITTGDALKAARYLSYRPPEHCHSDRILTEAIEAAHAASLIHQGQLEALCKILKRPETEL
jgi:hypothetical protein